MVHTLSPPSEEDASKAKEALTVLRGTSRTKSSRTVRIFATSDRAVQVPVEAYNLFLEILGQMANGNAVTLLPIHAELTTQQAAEILNISRPHLIKLIEDREIPYKQVGTHRRLRAEDVFHYKEKSNAERERVLDDLAAEAQRHDLGY